MSEETDRLAREAEERRSEVDDTIDRLKDRFSVGQIVEELSGYVREGQGADMVKNLNRQVRDNPLALGLIGAGAAWLLLGQGVRDQSQRVKDRYDGWRGEDWRDEDDRYDANRLSGGGYPIADGRPHTVGSGPYASDYGSGRATTSGGTYPASGSTGGSTSGGPGLADRARDAASGASNAAASAASGVAGAARSAGGSISDAASSAGGSISSAASSAGGAISGAASSAGGAISDAASAIGDRMGRAAHDARDAAYGAGDATYRGGAYVGRQASSLGRRAQRSFIDTLQEEPLIVGAIAVAIGAAIGAALPSTRREDELFGGTRDRLRDDAVDYGRDALSRAEHVAGEAYRAGSEEAERKGLKPSGEGETLAQKVSSVAKTAVDAAKDDVKKEGLV